MVDLICQVMENKIFEFEFGRCVVVMIFVGLYYGMGDGFVSYVLFDIVDKCFYEVKWIGRNWVVKVVVGVSDMVLFIEGCFLYLVQFGFQEQVWISFLIF